MGLGSLSSYFCFCQPSEEETNQQEVPPLMQKSIAYHDPENNWQQFKARLYLTSTDTTGKETPFEVEIDNNTGYFSHISHQDDKEIVNGISAWFRNSRRWGKPLNKIV